MTSQGPRDAVLRSIGRLLAAALVAACPGSAPAVASPDAVKILAGLQRWLDETADMHARFEQAVVSGALDVGLAEAGELWLERPGRMRWEYRTPEHKVALLVGDRTWLYVEEDAELLLGRLDEEVELLPALLAGERRLADWFLPPERVPAPDAPAAHVLRLRPREGARDTFEEAFVRVSRADHAVESVEVVDATGNRVRYTFRILERNAGVDAGRFLFEPPPGTVVSGRH